MLEVILFTFFKFQNSDFAHFLENVVYTNLNCHSFVLNPEVFCYISNSPIIILLQ